jgi:hypothetical protein
MHPLVRALNRAAIATGVLLCVLTAPSFGAGSADQRPSEPSYAQDFTLTYSSTALAFSRLGPYDIVEMTSSVLSNELGCPRVPVQEVRIALPPGIGAESVIVTGVDLEPLAGTYSLMPSQPARPLLPYPVSDARGAPDLAPLSSADPYPRQTVVLCGQTDLAGQGIAILQVYPLHYAPATGALTLRATIRFTVVGNPGFVCGDYLPRSAIGEGAFAERIEDLVINPRDVRPASDPSYPGPSRVLPAGGPYGHVVITPNSQSAYWAPLVDWHTKRGLKDILVTTEWIYANYSGSSNQQRIRNFVIDAYNTWGTLYYLMGGEVSQVPLEYRTHYDESTPSDQYYSDFDDDWTHEVFVGRVPAQSAAEVGLFLDKLFLYERTPTMTDYLLKAGLFGFDVDGSTRCQQLMETISGYMPSRFTKTKVYDSDGGSHLNAVTTALNAGQHLVSHGDHGDFDWWGIGYTNHGTGMYSSAVDALTNNNRMSIVTTLACNVNGFDVQDNCFSEHWVTHTSNPLQAGLAFNGNTRLGWYYVGDPRSLSGQLVRDWFAGLFQQDKYMLGETIVYSKHQFSTSGADAGVKRHCEWEFSLLGEPAMPIWTDTPATLSVTHPETLPTGASSFTVNVASGGAPLSGAGVCLWKGSEVYLTGLTNAGGNATFTPEPATVGTMYVTVTKHNYLPEESLATVVPAGAACCVGETCQVLGAAECAAAGGVYHPEWTDCGPPNPCARPHVCCVGEMCQLLLQTGCAAMGGVFHPEWDSCQPNPCRQPHVCCVAGECQLVLDSDCAAMEGEWHPEWSSCDDNPCQSQAAAAAAWNGPTMLAVAPQPSVGAARLAYALRTPVVVRLDVLDAAGRVVRHLVAGPGLAGPAKAEWDGRDDAGRPTSPGAYFCRLTAGTEVITKRLIRVE